MNDRTQYSVLSTRYLSCNPPLITLVLIFFAGGGVRAETLRWKLKPGDAFTVDTPQETESQVAFSGKSVTTNIDLALQQTWTVASAESKPASPDSVHQLPQQSLLVVPEKDIEQDDTCTTTPTLATAAGKFQQETVYRLVGTVQRGDRELAEIETTTRLSPHGSV